MSDENVYWTIPFSKTSIKRTVAVVYILSFSYSISFFIQMTVLPYLVKELEIDNIQFGYLQTIFGLSQLIGGPIFGQLCDAAGIRNCLALVHFNLALSSAIIFVSDNFWMLALSRAVCIFQHGQQAYQTVLSATTVGHERTATFSRLGVSFGIGFVAGPGVTALLSKLFGNRLPLLFAVGMCGLMQWLASHYVHVDKKPEADNDGEESSGFDLRGYYQVLQYPGVPIMFAQRILTVTPLILFTSILQIHLVKEFSVTPSDFSIFGVYVGMNMLFMNAVGVVWLRNRFSEIFLLRLGASLLICFYLGLTYLSQIWHFYIIIPALPIGMSLLHIITDTRLTSIVPDNRHGTVLGFSHASNAFLRTVTPVFAGYILEKLGFSTFGVIGMASCGAALVLMRK